MALDILQMKKKKAKFNELVQKSSTNQSYEHKLTGILRARDEEAATRNAEKQ
jgi:hypothetical protein